MNLRHIRAALAATLLLTAGLRAPAALPAATEADRLLLEAATEMEKERDISWVRVLIALETAEATGARMPENFQYHLGRALNSVGEYETGLTRLERYLAAQGSNAKYYKEALQAVTWSRNRIEDDRRRGVWERFEWADKENGELRDRKTGLVWQFCNSWRGIWDGRRCDGRNRAVTWAGTSDYARSIANRSGKPWRMPTRVELQEVAPYLPGTAFFSWTNEELDATKAYAISEYGWRRKALGDPDDPLGRPLERTFDKNELQGVRLVR